MFCFVEQQLGLLFVSLTDGIVIGFILGCELLTGDCENNPNMRPPTRPSIDPRKLRRNRHLVCSSLHLWANIAETGDRVGV